MKLFAASQRVGSCDEWKRTFTYMYPLFPPFHYIHVLKNSAKITYACVPLYLTIAQEATKFLLVCQLFLYFSKLPIKYWDVYDTNLHLEGREKTGFIKVFKITIFSDSRCSLPLVVRNLG